MIYEIPEHNVENFRKRLDILIRRAARFGASLKHSVIGHAERPIDIDGVQRRFIRYYRIDVTGDQPVVPNFKFIGTLEHTTEGNVLRMVPGETAPGAYRDTAPVCEHCRLNRTRRDTYLVKRIADNTVTQVGSGCLQDFLGHANPGYFAKLAEAWISVADLAETMTQAVPRGGLSYFRVDLAQFLAIAAEITLRHGFTSRAMVNKMIEKYGEHRKLPETTAHWAGRLLTPRSDMDTTESLAYVPSQEAVNLATAARDWVLLSYGVALPDCSDPSEIKEALMTMHKNENLSDFEHNLYVVAKGESVEPRTFGIAAYIIQAYRKANKMIASKSNSRVNSEHFGVVKNRFKALEVTCEKIHTWESDFGTGYLFKMVTEAGNVVIWKTYGVSEENSMEEGHRYVVSATVKSHGVFNNEKQTVVSRLKVVAGVLVQPQAEETGSQTMAA